MHSYKNDNLFLQPIKRVGALSHAPIDFYFSSSIRDFVVNEIPLYTASGKGEHLYITIRKKKLSTFELVEHLCSIIGAKKYEIGYAGLKDKNALTTQIISLPKKYLVAVEKFEHALIKILKIDYHTNKIRRGHLKGNRFFMRLKKVTPISAKLIETALQQLQEKGMANYFGYQRFGLNEDNYKLAYDIINTQQKMRDKVKRQFLFSALQSHYFNAWLYERVKFSHLFCGFDMAYICAQYPFVDKSIQQQAQFFKILQGDIMVHYPYGKFFYAQDVATESERFIQKQIVPTGLISGTKAKRAQDNAAFFEENFIQKALKEQGGRREAWVYIDNIEMHYIKEHAHVELCFSLPKGSYATVFLEQLANKSEIHKEEKNLPISIH